MATYSLGNEVTVGGAGPYEIVDIAHLAAVDKDVYYLGTINKIYFEEELVLSEQKVEDEVIIELAKKAGTPLELYALISTSNFQIPFEQFAKTIFRLIQEEKIEFKGTVLNKKALMM